MTLKLRGEKVERSFADILDVGALRRTWLRGVANIEKRYTIQVAAYNLGLVTRFPGFSIRIGFNLDLSMVCSGGDHGLGRSAHPAVSAGRRRLQDCDVRRSSEATRPGPEAVRRRGPDHGNLWRTAGPSQ